MDIYGTIKWIHELDHRALMARAVPKYGRENSYSTLNGMSARAGKINRQFRRGHVMFTR